jgi:hypothetical protein
MQWLTNRCLHQLVYRAYAIELASNSLAEIQGYLEASTVYPARWARLHHYQGMKVLF